jgi:type I restriction enzyme S subunit
MNTEALLRHYDRIADGTDAVERLRRFVLDLAVRGKLVPQDANEPPIQIDQGAMNRDSKKRHNRNKVVLPSSNTGRLNIPAGWLETDLSVVALINQGFAFPSHSFSERAEGSMPLIKIGDIGSDKTSTFVEGEFDSAYLVNAGDILVGLSGSIKAATWNGRISLLNQRIARLRAIPELVCRNWLYMSVISCIDAWKLETSKLTVQNIKSEQLYSSAVLVPPLAEQHRIVAKVDELMALCDRLETARAEREATRDRLAVASLARLNTPDPDSETFKAQASFVIRTALPALTTRPDQIKSLRQTILNLAVFGKLTSQSYYDEPTSVMISRLRDNCEKQRHGRVPKSLSLATTPETEGVFRVPHSWQWVNLGALGKTQTGSTPPKANARLFGNYVPFIKPGDLYEYSVDYGGEGLSEAGVEETGRLAPQGSLLMVCIGTIGKCQLIDRPCSFNQQINALTPYGETSSQYLLIALRSEYFQRLAWARSARTTISILNKGNWEKLPIPIPPVAEQHRIVAKVEELMALCDQLEAELIRGENTCCRLLDALLHEALAPAKEIEEAA